MNTRRVHIIILMVLFCSQALSVTRESASSSLSFQLGMANTSFTENKSTLKSENGTVKEKASGSASAPSLAMTYDFISTSKKSYFLKGMAPLLGAKGLFLASGGVNFFFTDLSGMFDFKDDGTSLTIQPKKRFFWGLEGGLGYLVYETETAKKNDMGFLISGHLGGMYNIKSNMDLVAQLGIGRLTGVETTSMVMQAYVGISYYLDPSR